MGVVSHGLYGRLASAGQPGGCGSENKLTAFASVAHFRGWIDGALAERGLAPAPAPAPAPAAAAAV